MKIMVEADMKSDDIAEHFSAVAKREARAILKDEIEKVIKKDLKSNEELSALIDETILDHIRAQYIWLGDIRTHEGFEDMTERDEQFFLQGARTAHLLDFKDNKGFESFEDILLRKAASDICEWVKTRQDLHNKLAIALRETMQEKGEE